MPEKKDDKKPNKNAPKKSSSPKPSSSKLATLANLFSMNPSAAVEVARNVVSQKALDRLAANISPYNYSDNETGESSTTRAINTIIKNRKELDRSDKEQYMSKGYGEIPEKDYRARLDLLQMYANRPQKYNTMQPSRYVPTEGYNPKDKYYSSKELENLIIEQLQLNKSPIRSEKDINNLITSNAELIYDEKTGKPAVGKGGRVAKIPGLGAATYGVKRDENNRLYLSYGDVWDLNPDTGVYGDQKTNFNTDRGIMYNLGVASDKAIGYVKDIGKDIITKAASPANVYGRIYFDEKTGKPIINDDGIRKSVSSDRIKKIIKK